MPRTKRLTTNNTTYHIITRGSQKQNVFVEHEDFERYSHLLWKYKNKFSAKIYAYCLMPNHVHLLAETPDDKSLSKTMHAINLSYAMYYNHKYDKCGHLWQNRYKGYLVQKDQYLINAITYIEHNPIRAEICLRAEEYKWSSYKYRVLGETSKLLDTLKGQVWD